ncbi:transmembrane protein 109 [Oxyura jamaicensis]|uniref:transmembrane protein 109 n=1 Tax=Oxyura jamaicensis TaxID=8884 RepID=UPI0015A58268|nr:transmembrane protein 109 [Oxyura jamaicensis]
MAGPALPPRSAPLPAAGSAPGSASASGPGRRAGPHRRSRRLTRAPPPETEALPAYPAVGGAGPERRPDYNSRGAPRRRAARAPPPARLRSAPVRPRGAALEGWLGPEPLRLLAEGLAAVLWLVSSAISAALAVLSAIVGDILSACGLGGAWLVRGAALAPGEVQRVLLWGLAALAGARLLPRLLGLVLAPLRPALRWLKLCCFLGAFLRVAAAEGSSPTVQAAMLLGLWGLYVLLGGGGGHPPSPEVRLEAAVRSLEWKVEELCRRQRWGGPQNREEE